MHFIDRDDLHLDSVHFLLPDGLVKSPGRHKIGHPQKFRDGMTFPANLRLFIVRKENRFYALSAVCTHLGCTVKKNNSSHASLSPDLAIEFDCPCHGSKFNMDGVNFAGPAKKPLERYFLSLSPNDGQIVVDMEKNVDKNFSLRL
ncbi:MAG: Rieske 2Fe-2S domain-containing protein [Actinobacteria bacterium]|nr:Rieske 2Fe-2S domain-containing protein [Actinomycetota bacterium]